MGSMGGAVESGERVAREIVAAAQRPRGRNGVPPALPATAASGVAG
jgi:hypothetical protein